MSTITKLFLSESEIAAEVEKLDRARTRLDAKRTATQAVKGLWPEVFMDPHLYNVKVEVEFKPELMGVRASQVTVHITRVPKEGNEYGGTTEIRSFPMDARLPVCIPTRYREPTERNKLLLTITAHINAY